MIVDVEIDQQPIERGFRHVDHVDVAESSAARLEHIFAIRFDPVAIDERFHRRLRGWPHNDIARSAAGGRHHAEHDAPIDGVREPVVEIGARSERLTIDRRDRIADRNAARKRDRSEWRDLGDDQLAG